MIYNIVQILLSEEGRTNNNHLLRPSLGPGNNVATISFQRDLHIVLSDNQPHLSYLLLSSIPELEKKG